MNSMDSMDDLIAAILSCAICSSKALLFSDEWPLLVMIVSKLLHQEEIEAEAEGR